MNNPPTQGTAFITGASAGLGAEFARQLASRGYALALTARRQERLEALADALRLAHNTQVSVLAADLATDQGVSAAEQALSSLPDLALLVNNAGYGIRGGFIKNPVEKELTMVQVHITAAVRLARAALPGMLLRNQGAIINVSSIAAFFPLRNTTYSATKAYLVNFSQGLQSELWGKHIRVQALCPGYVHTEFHSTPEMAGFRESSIPSLFWLNAPDVVASSLISLERGGGVCIPGWQYRLAAYFLRAPLTSALAQRFVRFLYSRRRP